VNNFLSEECVKCGITFSIFTAENGNSGEEGGAATEGADTKVICPQCGTENIGVTECGKCGIIFSKYFEIQHRETQEKERPPEPKAAEKDEQTEESEETVADPQEKLLREQEEREKAEAIRRHKEEKEKAEALRREKAEREKAEALRREKESREKADALRKEKEEQARAEAQRKEREEQEKAKSRQKAEDSLKEIKASQAKSIEAQLGKLEGETIGINFDDSGEIKGGRLVNVRKDFFSVIDTENDLVYSFPIHNILSIMEALNDTGISLKDGDVKYAAVIRVLQQGA
jgi:hypothetical protein